MSDQQTLSFLIPFPEAINRMQCSLHHQLQIRVLRVDMSTISDAVEATKMGNKPIEKPLPVKIGLKEYQQKRMTIKAKIKYREHSLQQLSGHLKNGTFPKRMKSIKPYPQMDTPEAQAIVNAACDQVQGVILGQMIQEQALKLKQDRDSCENLKKERLQQRQQRKARKLERELQTSMITVVQLQRELRDLQSKYTELCQKLTPVKQEPQES